jgi:hypothetical protein
MGCRDDQLEIRRILYSPYSSWSVPQLQSHNGPLQWTQWLSTIDFWTFLDRSTSEFYPRTKYYTNLTDTIEAVAAVPEIGSTLLKAGGYPRIWADSRYTDQHPSRWRWSSEGWTFSPIRSKAENHHHQEWPVRTMTVKCDGSEFKRHTANVSSLWLKDTGINMKYDPARDYRVNLCSFWVCALFIVKLICVELVA